MLNIDDRLRIICTNLALLEKRGRVSSEINTIHHIFTFDLYLAGGRGQMVSLAVRMYIFKTVQMIFTKISMIPLRSTKIDCGGGGVSSRNKVTGTQQIPAQVKEKIGCNQRETLAQRPRYSSGDHQPTRTPFEHNNTPASVTHGKRREPSHPLLNESKQRYVPPAKHQQAHRTTIEALYLDH